MVSATGDHLLSVDWLLGVLTLHMSQLNPYFATLGSSNNIPVHLLVCCY